MNKNLIIISQENHVDINSYLLQTHAIVTKSGELKIISAGEESDADLLSVSSR